MNSRNRRDRRDHFEPFEIRVRESLMSEAGRKAPSPEARRLLLERAGRQQRGLGWRWRLPSLSFAVSSLFDGRYSRLVNANTETHVLYVEALFGPRLGWASFNQLIR
jgi:hypothetical protein